jgi:hypothetical protein
MFESVRPRALVLEYAEIEERPRESIKKIARHLRISPGFLEARSTSQALDKASLARKATALQSTDDGVVDVGFSFYDRKTFLHRDHISIGTRKRGDEFFSQDELTQIRRTLAPFLTGV